MEVQPPVRIQSIVGRDTEVASLPAVILRQRFVAGPAALDVPGRNVKAFETELPATSVPDGMTDVPVVVELQPNVDVVRS